MPDIHVEIYFSFFLFIVYFENNIYVYARQNYNWNLLTFVFKQSPVLNTVVGNYINTRKTTFLFKFYVLSSLFRIISLQVNI